MNAPLGMTGRTRRWMLGVGGCVVLLGFGAASAWAAPASHTPRVVAAVHGFAGVAPAATAASYDPPFATFSTDPVDVTINSVVYQMTVNVTRTSALPVTSPSSTSISTARGPGSSSATRTTTTPLRPRRGSASRYGATNGKTAALKATAAIAPSAVSIAYKSTLEHGRRPGSLQNGTTGDQVVARTAPSRCRSSPSCPARRPSVGTVTTKPKTAVVLLRPRVARAAAAKLGTDLPRYRDIEVGNASSCGALVVRE